MNNGLPNSVRSALARQPAGQPHPSADLLSAYAEHVLTAREQQEIATHLASCSECREVVFLASESRDEEAVAPAVVVPARRWRWMTWAAPATAAVVVASVVFIEYPRKAAEKTRVHQVEYSAPAPAGKADIGKDEDRDVAKAPLPGVKPEARLGLSSSTEVAAEAQAAPKAAAPILAAPQVAPNYRSRGELNVLEQQNALQQAKGGALMRNQAAPSYDKLKSAEKERPFTVADLSKQTASISNKPSGETVPATGGMVGGLRQGPAVNQPARKVASAPAPVAPAAPAQSVGNADSAYSAPDEQVKELALDKRNFVKLSQVEPGVAPGSGAHWRITPEGAVEWSTEPDIWNTALTGHPMKFRVVAIAGADIWAGGNGGMLFHSTDNGATWTVVPLSDQDTKREGMKDAGRRDKKSRTGAIVSIRFSDVQNGEIRTDKGERWVTTDRGQTWTRK